MKIPILKEFERFEWFEWFEWFGPSPIDPINSRPSQQVRFDRRVVLRVHEDDVHRPVREVPGRLQRGPRDEAPA